METKPTYEELEQRVAELEKCVERYNRSGDARSGTELHTQAEFLDTTLPQKGILINQPQRKLNLLPGCPPSNLSVHMLSLTFKKQACVQLQFIIDSLVWSARAENQAF